MDLDETPCRSASAKKYAEPSLRIERNGWGGIRCAELFIESIR